MDNKATNLIAKVDYAISNKTKDSYQYKYDDRGNITKIIENGFVVNEYFYDELNRLTKEVNHRNKTKKEYFYDTNGNIRNKITYNLTTNEVINKDNYNQQ